MTFLRRLRHLFRRQKSETEMAEEMRFHLEERAEDLADDGLPSEEARYAAQRKFGNVTIIQENARETHGWSWLERALKDLNFAVRQLIKAPGFTFLAIGTLALGIGANTAMFSVQNSVQLKPLPYAESAQLDLITRVTAQNAKGRISVADFLDLQREVHGYSEIAAYTQADTSLSEPGKAAEIARTVLTTTNFLSTLRVQTQLGRDFRPGEDVPGNDRVVMISNRCWQKRFGGKDDIIGRVIRVDGEPHEIVGVLPDMFNDWRHLGWVDVFRPLALDEQKASNRATPLLRVIGRRSGKFSRAETAGFIASFGAHLATEYPEVNAGSTWRTVSLNDTVIAQNGKIMMPMMVALSGFVLLIACFNLANLLLARTIARAREFAVRSALGASRTQLLRPLVAEALLLALAGGVCAVILALWITDYFSYRTTGENGERVFFPLDGHVLGWALGASLVTVLVFGLAPALFAMRLNLSDTLKSGGRGTTGGRGHQLFRHGLIVAQFALSMVLLAGAALFIRGFHELNHRRSGWQSEQLVTATVVLPTAAYPNNERITAFHRLTLERLEALPGVTSASISSFTPFFTWPDLRKYLVDGRELPQRGHEPAALVNTVSPRYFETVGTRVLAGRTFSETDTAMSPKVFVISQSTATGLFGNENPIGQRLAQAGDAHLQWGEIVGIVADVKSVTPEAGPVTFQLYQPMAQQPVPRNEIVVRAADGVGSVLIERIRSTMTTLDPDLPVRNLQAADVTVYRANYQLTVLRDILGGIAVLGLAIASLGVYGVIARTMVQRSGEFAIRLALGASIQNITRLVLTSGVKLALIGSALGLFGAFGVSRLISSGFPGMHFDTTFVLIGATVLLVTVALVASWLPARRAGKVDAMMALRAE